jgi:hypothetical protein
MAHFQREMKFRAMLFWALCWTAVAAGAAEPAVKVFVVDNAVLCVSASRVPANVPDQIGASALPNHLAGTVLDLRFADDAAANAADYFVRRKSPLVVLINSQTRGAAAALAMELRRTADAVLIGSTNVPGQLTPDIVVSVSPEDEVRFQADPFFKTAAGSANSVAATNLLAFVDHTSEAELVRKRIKDGDEDGEVPTPRVEPSLPVISDPALARAADLLKALAALHPARA